MENLITSPAPHIHGRSSSRRIMLDVIIALLPAAAAGIIIFGARALAVLAACVISAAASEFLFNIICRKPQTAGDLSAVVTGLLLGLNLSAAVPIWQCVVGSAFAIIVVKCLFGGLGRNIANPAITARVFMLISFSSVAGGALPKGVDAVSSATPLELLSTGGELPSVLDMLLGLHGGAIGETCSIALLAGLLYLLLRKIVSWHIPCVFTATVFLCFWIYSGDLSFALYEILSGGLFIGAFFMATDYVTSPVTKKGKLIFAVGCGALTFIIRSFCAYPEGVSFSILIMNLFVPLIEKFTPNIPLGGSR